MDRVVNPPLRAGVEGLWIESVVSGRLSEGVRSRPLGDANEASSGPEITRRREGWLGFRLDFWMAREMALSFFFPACDHERGWLANMKGIWGELQRAAEYSDGMKRARTL